MVGAGTRLTPALSLDTKLRLESATSLPGGSVDLVYACE
jgi:hypothetical protein